MTRIIQIIVIFLNLGIGTFVLSQNLKSRNNRIFSLMAFLAAIWTFENYMVEISTSLSWLQGSYALGALVISTGLIWTLSITESKIVIKKYIVITFTGLLFFCGSFLPHFIVNSPHQIYTGAIIYGDPGWGMFLYTIYYAILAFLIIWKLHKAQLSTKNKELRKQYKNIFYGASTTLIVTFVSSFILPFFSIFPFGATDNVGFLIFLLFITYAITKHHLFNIRVIAVEVVTVALWMLILIRLLLAQNMQETIIDASMLLITIIFGIILIRSTLKEITQREHIERLATDLKDLNQNLETKVAEQTHEVRKAYELEKKTHKELERLNETKDQFIMITQHHLRTPVTTITWSLEAMLKGDYGSIKPEMEKALQTTKSAARRLTRIVDDFLSITAIKIGTQILNIASASLKPLLEDVISELDLDIKNKKIRITYSSDEKDWPSLPIDANKIREVLLIVIENAVRYNFENGSINIRTHVSDDLFELKVKNTGIGMENSDKEKLFTSLFHRSEAARNAHALGMGVGLSVSRAIIRAHRGNIRIESAGINEGAEVTIELPSGTLPD